MTGQGAPMATFCLGPIIEAFASTFHIDHLQAQALALAPVSAEQEEDRDHHEERRPDHNHRDGRYRVGALELEHLQFMQHEDG